VDQPTRLSLTPTISRQTPRAEFGSVLQVALQQAGQAGAALLSAIPGGGILSAAIGSVTGLASRSLQAGPVVASGGLGGQTAVAATTTATADLPGGVSAYVDQMRQEADRSLLMQLQMQQESREYNALSNVLKVRHDSAKAAINNLR
jgi:hypothetical protein